VKKYRIVYMGTPEFAIAPLHKLMEEGYDIAAVVTTPDKPAGRGRKLSRSAVKIFAEQHGLLTLQPHNLKDPDFISQLRKLEAQLYIVVAFRMLPEAVWKLPSKGTFNLHSSLLPQYRGAAPINHAIINGERYTGVTTFMIDHNIDTGNILFQEKCEIDPHEDAGSLHDKLMEIGASLVVKTANAIFLEKITPSPQENSKILKPAPKLNKENSTIDWNKDSSYIYNFIRGLSPYPAAHSLISNGEKNIPVKIFRSTILKTELNDTSKPGTIYTDNKSFLKVKCGKGALLIENIQTAGKKRLNIKEFLAGFRGAENYNFK
jgi:methionyl-tRNA formyltransferase